LLERGCILRTNFKVVTCFFNFLFRKN